MFTGLALVVALIASMLALFCWMEDAFTWSKRMVVIGGVLVGIAITFGIFGAAPNYAGGVFTGRVADVTRTGIIFPSWEVTVLPNEMSE